ncbi:MAG: di-trans,poly-cis-decaprenylcistransferase [Candidatus Nanopelagicaceae bacterium]|nr:di-trans,poly-cis-decaprenylcistransferase [Candidatus Nanopelagicaceae bacterium]
MKLHKPEPHWSGAKPPVIEKSQIPKHVAVVMDGNGRWAKNKGLVRTEGHRAGEAPLFDMVEGAIEIGVKELSAYAFSTENWKRSPEEVKFLMGFNKEVLRRRRDQMNELGVRIRWIGQEKKLWSSVVDELLEAEELTSKNKVLTLNMCVNYGGRAEIVSAAEALARDFKRGKVSKFDEKSFTKYLELPSDVDLFLRSSGEQRLSNFLPWQSAYAELVFMDVLWPDADRRTLWKAIEEYASRNRRFGKA